MFIYHHANPSGKTTGDCVIRAISLLENIPWRQAPLELTAYSYFLYELADDNDIWSRYLIDRGYKFQTLPNTCPLCYTLRRFCHEHPYGEYMVCTGSHVIAVIDGNYYDTWDSGDEVVTYYFRKGN